MSRYSYIESDLDIDSGLEGTHSAPLQSSELTPNDTESSFTVDSYDEPHVVSFDGTEGDFEQSQGEPNVEAESDSESYSQYTQEEAEDIQGFFSSVATEYGEHGAISEDTYQELQDMGLPAEVIDTYFTGLEFLEQKFLEETASSVGGVDNMQMLLNWAGKTFTDHEMNSFNHTIETGSQADVQLAFSGLLSQYEQREGSISNLALMGGTGSQPASTYSNRSQWLKDTSDPRYNSDQRYREKVERKFLASIGTMDMSSESF